MIRNNRAVKQSGGKEKGCKDQAAREDRVLYWVLTGFLALIFMLTAVIRGFHLEQVFFKPCMFRLLTGWYCPGCGGTRAFIALISGRIGDSIRLHPLIGYGAAFLAVFWGSHTLSYLSGGRIRGLRYRHRYLAAAAVITAVNWMIKNYFLLVKGIDLLESI